MAISNPEDCNLMQGELREVYAWADANKMLFNDAKFEHLRYNSSNSISNIFLPGYIASSGNAIDMIYKCRDLGVCMSASGSFEEHIDEVVLKCKRLTGWILRTFISREAEHMVTLFKSLVLPIIEYGCVVWSPSLLFEIRRLEAIQRHFTSKIRGLSDLSYSERLEHLKLYSLERRRDRYSIIYTFKMLKGLVPNFNDLNLKVSVRIHTSERTGLKCRIPSIETKSNDRVKTLKDRSFAIRGPSLFNSLPQELRNLEISLETFKNRLDTYLCKVLDRPIDANNPQVSSSNCLIAQILLTNRN